MPNNSKRVPIILSQESVLPDNARNTLVIGCAGSGKTRNYVLPNLLQCAGSYVVTDVCGVRAMPPRISSGNMAAQSKSLMPTP